MLMKTPHLRLLLALVACASLAAETDGARILGVFHYNGKSHFMVFESLMKALAARGHQVDVLSHFPQKTPVPNYTDIDVSGTAPDVLDNITIDMALSWRMFSMADFIWVDTREVCRRALDHINVQALLRSSAGYDLVVTEIFGSECAVGFARRFGAPLVHVISSVALPWTHARIGNPDHPAYVPSYFLPYTHRMDFFQRLANTVLGAYFRAGNYFYNERPTSALMRRYFGEDVPSVEELVANSSLVLVNSHFSINWPRPAVPAFVEVGGMHIQEPKKLPQDLEKFLNESTHGVVYFNLGSLVRVQTFPEDKLNALLDAFGALPERVLMKYTGDSLPGKPDNVMTSKWIPQMGVLSHPKTKVFVSHGGLGSTHETVHSGVPVVGMPLFADQESNINNLRELGMAAMLRYEDLTKDSLLRAIRTVIDNSSYSESARRVSAVFRDRPLPPMDTAVYWVEYVARHRGAPHLRSAAAGMPLHRYLLLDVFGVLAGVLLLAVWAARRALLLVLRVTRPRPRPKRD
ncbi:UDP-glucosyltransferase 2-like [Bacillus rossius redtenbacheri]|uniref:UDP-glucosyltransferase 2-like n=1 Tax=Bacillus rossius redtenbacheri TaxID=93214 RepID=UPI002FDCA7F2